MFSIYSIYNPWKFEVTTTSNSKPRTSLEYFPLNSEKVSQIYHLNLKNSIKNLTLLMLFHLRAPDPLTESSRQTSQ